MRTLTLPTMASVLALSVASGAAFAQSADDIVFPIGEDPRFNWESLDRFQEMDLSGEEVTVLGPWLGPDRDLVNSVLAVFEEATGADVVFAGSDSMEQQIVIDFQAGSPPNVTVFPQPGLAADLAAQGALSPLGDEMQEWVLENYAAGSSWVDLGTYPDENGDPQFFGFFYKVDLKSIVWYSPENLEDAGYDVPTTMEDLIAVSEDIAANGETPWCIGIASGDATGWPATDWVEDIMLRTQPPEVYDAWTTNEIPFDDPRVVNAIEIFGSFAKNPDWVDGGVAAVGAIDFRDSPRGLFEVPPGCYFHRQASFITSFFPEGTELGVDADFFYFPPFEAEDLGNPVLGAGTLWAISNDSPGARALIDFLTTPLAAELWMAQSGHLSPHLGVNLDAYANDTLRRQGEILLAATTFRFDGSDLMPGAIGAGAFWTAMVDYVSGEEAADAAAGVQRAWQSLQ